MEDTQVKKYRRAVNIKNDGYQKNGNSVQDNLTAEDIQLLLEEYEQIASYDELKEGMHIRYYTTVKKKQVFRMGGTIIKLDLEKKFAVLTNGYVNWSVQLNPNTIIYKKMTTEEVKEFYENELDNREMEIEKYKSNIEKLKNAYRQLKTENEELKSELSRIKKFIKKAGI